VIKCSSCGGSCQPPGECRAWGKTYCSGKCCSDAQSVNEAGVRAVIYDKHFPEQRVLIHESELEITYNETNSRR